MEGVLLEISLIVGIAALISIIARAIKQPPIIAYLISGIIVGPLALGIMQANELMQVFAHIGIALLLFIVGLSLDFRILKDIGGVALFAGLGEIALTAVIGFLILIGLGFSYVPALYIGAALAFSSTVVVVKILSDKKEIDTLHGRIALGILIVEDFVAGIVLMIVPLIQNSLVQDIFISVGKAALLAVAIFALSGFGLNRFLHYLARNQEVLFLFGIAWALLISTLFGSLGFSLEIGALIAGMSLASTKYTLELGGKMKPLRDFFIVLFFVFFGSQLSGNFDFDLIRNALILSVFIFIGKPLGVMIFMRFAGYTKRTNFLTGTSIAQLSEFSLILILLGYNLGQLSQETMNLVILVALITIGASSYSIYYSHSIFEKIGRFLSIFDGRKYKKELTIISGYDVVLFGYNRLGYSLLKSLRKMKARVIVIDYNPKTIFELGKKGVDCVYGDANDSEFVSELKLDKAKMVISTISREEANLIIKRRLEEVNSKAVFIATSEQVTEAIDLYKQGVDYVIVPHVLGGDYASEMLESNKMNPENYRKEGKENLKELKERTR